MKNKVLRILFILSFIPYLFILYSIFFNKYYMNGVELYGTKLLLVNFVSIFDPSHFGIFSPSVVACFTFQMIYLFRESINKMIICSFIPSLFVLLMGIRGAFWGAKFLGDSLSYGLEGFEIGIFEGIIYYVLIPIIPACIIFQIVCLVIKHKKASLI